MLHTRQFSLFDLTSEAGPTCERERDVITSRFFMFKMLTFNGVSATYKDIRREHFRTLDFIGFYRNLCKLVIYIYVN